MSTPYDFLAPYYDLDHAGHADDIEFYKPFVDASSGPVLICGVGTGRIPLGLGECGCELVGIDSSEEMLGRARAKLPAMALELCDMRTFNLGCLFDLIIVPLDVFGSLTTMDDRSLALRSIRRSLTTTGLVIVDMTNPAYLAGYDGPTGLQQRFQVWEGATRIDAHEAMSVDDDAQTMTIELRYETTTPTGSSVDHITVPMGWVTQSQFAQVAAEAGLEVSVAYGEYDRTPFDSEESSRLICLLLPSDVSMSGS